MLSISEETRRAVETEIAAEARVSGAYYILIICACGVATLGLLQSSAAVVIGAMLISPLMGPILGMGLSLAMVEPRGFRRALVTLALGALLAVLASVIIVWASPLNEATPEILARTRPTLLDLVVAILSGVVAAYVTITRKGGVIAGVAIATALMPPLAVTGYGLATGSPTIAGGAFLLFMTNVVAILGCVFVVARLFGFKPAHKIQARWQELGLAAAILIFALPLGFSLRDIAVEARQTHRARSAIERQFTNGKPRIDDLRIAIEDGALKSVKAVVITPGFVSDLGGKVSAALDGVPEVDVQQILTAQGEREEKTPGGALGNQALAGSSEPPSPEQHLRDLLGGVGAVEGVRRDGRRLTAMVRLEGKADLADYQALEAAADRLSPTMDIRLIPPLMPLPAIPFVEGRSVLDGAAERNARTAAWALARWGIKEVAIEGFASPGRNGATAADRRVAMKRGQSVAEILTNQGMGVTEITAIVPPLRDGAASSLWRVDIRPRGEVRPVLDGPARP
ncbi:DUF389 domain-containing protein [Sphingopyxis sp.]|uniref:DUF389 domain-containing protein n=1 Tax=Sphingopyxis sp. TaxID=1908224 RepID=UPI002B491DC8|nr:DUF389 domain-containing protein [Sphingopyxis sp.]HJS10503.1 DUF389 domain-containing protein [Sphingopyxis sp.]HKY80064.1 DUF389 domain-containing protein [Sphingobium sp.]